MLHGVQYYDISNATILWWLNIGVVAAIIFFPLSVKLMEGGSGRGVKLISKLSATLQAVAMVSRLLAVWAVSECFTPGTSISHANDNRLPACECPGGVHPKGAGGHTAVPVPAHAGGCICPGSYRRQYCTSQHQGPLDRRRSYSPRPVYFMLTCTARGAMTSQGTPTAKWSIVVVYIAQFIVGAVGQSDNSVTHPLPTENLHREVTDGLVRPPFLHPSFLGGGVEATHHCRLDAVDCGSMRGTAALSLLLLTCALLMTSSHSQAR